MNGFELSITQIDKIVKNSNGGIELVASDQSDDFLILRVAIACNSIPHKIGGHKLRAREEFIIHVPKDFPYSVPSVDSTHKRFNKLPHVQWGTHICLYRSEALEWNVEKGLYGLFHRLIEWLEKVSEYTLTSNDIHLHPPANINSEYSLQSIIPSVDCPVFNEDTWIGYGLISNFAHNVYELIEFSKSINWKVFQQNRKNGQVYIPVFLSKKDFPYDYPETADNFFREVVLKHFDERQIFEILLNAVSYYSEKIKYFVCFGTLMRRKAGDKCLKFHLTFWEFGHVATADTELAESSLDENYKLKLDVNIEILRNYVFPNSKIKWARVMENRPEVIAPRDSGSLMNFKKNEKVVLLGCGALGSNFADSLCRAGVKNFFLIDKDFVTYGVLCRQNYKTADVGMPKATRLGSSLKELAKGISSEACLKDFTQISDSEMGEIFQNADIFINSTGSNLINFKLEQLPKEMRATYNFTTIIDGKSENALFVGWHKYASVGSYTLNKYLQQVLSEDPETVHLSKLFWPKEGELNNQLFEPEPGCSEPTFQAGVQEVREAAVTLQRGIMSSICNISKSESIVGWVKRDGPRSIVQWKVIPNPDIELTSCQNYKVLFSKNAKASLIEEIKNGYSKRGKDVENGGVILGHISDFLKTIWIDRITDAPMDSEFDRTEFICGTNGLEAKINAYKKRFNEQTYYLGTWHTHPDGSSEPSQRDRAGARGILEDINYKNPNVLFLIVGDNRVRTMGFHVFKKEDLSEY